MFKVKLPFLKICLPGLCLVAVLASCASSGGGSSVGVPFAAEPEWVRNPYANHDRQAWLAASGSGNSRQAAEANAIRALASIFGVDVDATLTVVDRETVGAGASSSSAAESRIETTVTMDSLIGAEIAESWDNGRGTNFAALAVLNRQKAIGLYQERIRANQAIIDELTNLPPGERNTLGGFSRHMFAADIADANAGYAELLSVLGSPQTGLARGDDFRRMATEIAAATPVGMNVRGDRAGRLQGAFSSAFSGLGFRTGGANARYVLNVNIVVQEPDISGSNVFARMELTANLTDTTTGTVLLPYTFNLREGHRTFSEAENRTFIQAERRINEEYRNLLSDYLFQLIPRR